MYFYENKNSYKIISLIFMVITFIEISILGNRSSMLICIFMIIYYEIKNISNYNCTKTLIKLIISIILITFISENIIDILISIKNILESIGVYSYSITKYIRTLQEGGIAGVIEQSSGRDVLYSQVIDIIKNANFAPKGVNYFYYITGGLYLYPHNLFLEILLDFGIIGFILFLIITIILIIKYIKQAKYDKEFKDIVCLMLIFSLTRLMVSTSYWREAYLWSAIGFIIFYNKTKETKYSDITID